MSIYETYAKGELLAGAGRSGSVFLDYLMNRYDDDTAGEIFTTFLAMCFATDGKLSFGEYELMKKIAYTNYSYDSCVALINSCLNNEDVVDEIIRKAPKEVREQISVLCIAIAAIDGTITVDEKQMCYKYFLASL